MSNPDFYEWAKAEKRALARYVQWENLPKALAWPSYVNQLNLVQNKGLLGVAKVLYDLVLDQKLQYALELFHPEANETQRIRKPTTILETKQATCLDLAVLFATMGLANDLLPIVVAVDGHAFVGFSHKRTRRNTAKPPHPHAWNQALLEGQASALTDFLETEYFFLECTGATQSQTIDSRYPEGQGRSGDRMSFEWACEAGRAQFSTTRPFLYALDIYLLQTQYGFKPQPEVDVTVDNPSSTTFDQRGQTVTGPQTNIAGDVKGPIFSGSFQGPVNVGDVQVGAVSGTNVIVGHGAQQTTNITNTGSGAINTGSGAAAGAGGLAIGGSVRGNVYYTPTSPDGQAAQVFAAIAQRIQALPAGAAKEDAQDALKKLEAEAPKGEQADERRLKNAMGTLIDALPDAWEVALKTVLHPLAGLGTVFQKVVTRMRAEREKP